MGNYAGYLLPIITYDIPQPQNCLKNFVSSFASLYYNIAHKVTFLKYNELVLCHAYNFVACSTIYAAIWEIVEKDLQQLNRFNSGKKTT